MLQIIRFIIPRELDFVVSAPTTQQVTTIREQKRERTTAFMNNIARQLEPGDVKRCPKRGHSHYPVPAPAKATRQLRYGDAGGLQRRAGHGPGPGFADHGP